MFPLRKHKSWLRQICLALTGVSDAEDTASEDDGEFSQVGGSFSMFALRPPMTKNTPRQTSILNHFEGLDEEIQVYDHQLVQDLNSFAHRVYAEPPKIKKPPQEKSKA